VYRFPWLKYQASAPTPGRDFLMQLQYSRGKTLSMYLRYRHQQNYRDDDGLFYTSPRLSVQGNLRYNILLQILPEVKLKTRVEYVRVRREQGLPEQGVAMAQDIVYQKIGIPISFALRYVLFDTKSYASRIYMYENDLPYTSSTGLLYDKGQRIYGMISWDISRQWELWLRVSRSVYDRQEKLYAGTLNEIDGNTLSEIKIACRWRL